jgi:hypothetical protein
MQNMYGEMSRGQQINEEFEPFETPIYYKPVEVPRSFDSLDGYPIMKNEKIQTRGGQYLTEEDIKLIALNWNMCQDEDNPYHDPRGLYNDHVRTQVLHKLYIYKYPSNQPPSTYPAFIGRMLDYTRPIPDIRRDLGTRIAGYPPFFPLHLTFVNSHYPHFIRNHIKCNDKGLPFFNVVTDLQGYPIDPIIYIKALSRLTRGHDHISRETLLSNCNWLDPQFNRTGDDVYDAGVLQQQQEAEAAADRAAQTFVTGASVFLDPTSVVGPYGDIRQNRVDAATTVARAAIECVGEQCPMMGGYKKYKSKHRSKHKSKHRKTNKRTYVNTMKRKSRHQS